MKKYVLMICVLNAMLAHGQTKKGTIVYQRKLDVYRRLLDEQMKAMVPQFQTAKSQLIFNDSVSIYKALPEENAPDPFEHEGGHKIMMKFGGPGENAVLYHNYSNQKFLEQTELGEKTYVITDTIKPGEWKLSDETRMVLNHPCKKATMKTKRGTDVIAWYADDIASPAGPDVFGGLSGAILFLDINNAEVVYMALEVNDKADAADLKEPTKGKMITRADFGKKLDELFGPASPDGKRIIRMNN